MVRNTIVHTAHENQEQCAIDVCIYQPIAESSEEEGTMRDPSPNTSMKHQIILYQCF